MRRNLGGPAVSESFRMRVSIRTLAVAVAALLTAAAPAGAQSVVSTPSNKTLYKTGPTGRYLMDGTWLFKLDNHQSGPQLESGIAGWKQVTVPNAWNVGDDSPQSFLGGVGWYRKDFKLPTASKRRRGWCASSRSTTARRSGSTASRSARTAAPTCRSRSACRPGCSSAAASTTWSSGSTRAASRPTSRPPGLSIVGEPTGGWWNYGGLLREVYLRKINDVDFNTVVVRPDLPCATCPATVTYRVTLRNYGPSAAARRRQRALRRAAHLHRPASRSAPSASRRSPSRSRSTSRACGRRPARTSTTRPWRSAPGGSLLQRYTLKTGIRSIKVVDGHLFLNGAPMNFRGVALHEDSKTMGFAIDNKTRDQQLAWVKELGRDRHPLALPAGARTRRSAPTSWGSCSGRRSRSTRSRRSTSSRSSCASLRRASSSRTSRPTATTRR